MQQQLTLIVCAALLLFLYMPNIASANEVEETDADALERIQITLKYGTRSLQQTPASIAVLNAQQIQQWRVDGADALADSLPNVMIRGLSSINSGFTIRGVGADNWHVNANQGVSQNLDETALLSPFTSQLALFDLQRIEVLKGPQNTLFGLNNTGGAVNYTTVKPQTGERQGFVEWSQGRFSQQVIEAAYNAPLSDSTALRAAVFNKQRDGLWRNLYNDRPMGGIDQRAARLHFLWEIDDHKSLLASMHSARDRSSKVPFLGAGYWDANGSNVLDGRIVDVNAPADCPEVLQGGVSAYLQANNCVSILPFSGLQASPVGAGDWYSTYDAAEDRANVDFDSLRLRYVQQTALGELVSVTSIDKVSAEFIQSLSNLPSGLGFMPGQQLDTEQIAQELRWSYQAQDNTQWLLGLYASEEDNYFGTVISRTDEGGAPFGIVPAVSIQQTTQVLSAYTNIIHKLSSKWQVDFGLRHSLDRKEGTSTVSVAGKTQDGTSSGQALDFGRFVDRQLLAQLTAQAGGACPPSVGGLPCLSVTDINSQEHLTGGNLGLHYKWTEQINLFAQLSRGYLTGGFDTRALAAFSGRADKPVLPESVNAIELGTKFSIFDDKVSGIVSYFYYDWHDKQVFDITESGETAFLNIPRSTLHGAELALQYAMNKHWRAELSLGLLNTEITDIGTLTNTQQGSELANTPSYSGVLSVFRKWQSSYGETQATLQMRFVDDYYNQITNVQSTKTSAYAVVNAGIQHQIALDKNELSVLAGIENITAEKYCVNISDNTGLSYALQCMPNAGTALWSVKATYRF